MRHERQSFRQSCNDARAVPASRLRRQRSDGVGPCGAGAAGIKTCLEVFDEVLDVAAASVFRSKLDPLRSALVRVPNCVALQPNICRSIKLQRQIEPLRLAAPFIAQERLADLIL